MKTSTGTERQKLAILISGRGSNMLAVVKACLNNQINADVCMVLSNRSNAAGLKAAKALGIQTAVVEHDAFRSRQQFDDALHKLLCSVSPDWIVLAGFMRILGDDFVNHWNGRLINIHPSLLPAYPGLNTHARALDAGDKEAGATVHMVSTQLDAGPLIAQVRVPVMPEDTPETLAARVLAEEHGLLVNALKQCVNTTDR